MTAAIPSPLSQAAYSILKNLTIMALAFGFFILFLLSIIVRDTHFITENPNKFMIELFLMSVLAALPIFYIGYSRGLGLSSTVTDFLLLMVKFAALHIGFQLSGFYTNIFAE